MTNIKKKLQKIIKFQEFVEKRAIELIEAKGYNEYKGHKYNFYFTAIEYDTDNVSCEFEESTRHDCPEKGSVKLSLSDLQMNDDEWDVKILRIKADIHKAKSEQAEKQRQYEIIKKEREYQQLKEELGK